MFTEKPEEIVPIQIEYLSFFNDLFSVISLIWFYLFLFLCIGGISYVICFQNILSYPRNFLFSRYLSFSLSLFFRLYGDAMVLVNLKWRSLLFACLTSLTSRYIFDISFDFENGIFPSLNSIEVLISQAARKNPPRETQCWSH